MEIKRFLFKLFLFAPIWVGVMAVNYKVDPGNLFNTYGSQYVKELVIHLTSGKNVWGLNPSHDERLKQKFVIGNFTEPKDIVVLGSSRCKGIHQGLFPGKTFYNAGVSAAVMKDYIGIYQLFYEQKVLPKTIIMELSAWILNPNNDLVHGDVQTIEPEYQRGSARMNLSSSNITHIKDYSLIEHVRLIEQRVTKKMQIVSPAYLQQSLGGTKGIERALGRIESLFSNDTSAKLTKSRGHVKSGRMDFNFTDGNIKDEFILMADGSWISPEENRIVTLAEAIRHRTTPKGIERFRSLPKDQVNEFEVFVNQMIADGVEVAFFLPLWPPETYEGLITSEKYRIVKVEESYFRTFAQKHGIKIYGSYNPNLYGFTRNDFADVEHLRRSAIPRLFGNRLPGSQNISQSNR